MSLLNADELGEFILLTPFVPVSGMEGLVSGMEGLGSNPWETFQQQEKY